MRTLFFTTISKEATQLALLLSIASAFSLAGCNYSVLKKAGTQASANNQAGLPGQPSGQPIFVDAAVVEKSVLNSCVQCHGAGGEDPELASVTEFRANIDDAISQIDKNKMPQKLAPLNDCQKAILHKWKDLGLPTTSAVDTSTLPACAAGAPATKPAAPAPVQTAPVQAPPVAPPTSVPSVPALPQAILEMPVTYQTFLTQILQPKCVACHDTNSGDPDASQVLFFPFSQITTKTKLFAGPSSTSRFLKLVTRTDGKQMPPSDSSMPHLTNEELAFVAKWIDAGTPEN